MQFEGEVQPCPDAWHTPPRLIDSQLTFAQVRRANRSRCERWHPGFPDDRRWTGGDWGNAMAGEAGEACNVVKKLRRIETGYAAAICEGMVTTHECSIHGHCSCGDNAAHEPWPIDPHCRLHGRHGCQHGVSRTALLAALSQELADVVLYADLLAQKYGLRLEDCIPTKFNRVSREQGFPERLAG